jgi:hypothetical protein
VVLALKILVTPFLQSWDTDNLAKTLANSTFDL